MTNRIFTKTTFRRVFALLLPLLCMIVLKTKAHSVALKGKVINEDKGVAVAGAEILIVDEIEKTSWRQITDGQGSFTSQLSSQHSYRVYVKYKGYFMEGSSVIKTAAETEIKKEFKLKEVILGRAIRLEHINFDVNDDNIALESLLDIEKFYESLEQNNNLVVEIGVHTDARGNDTYNLQLSQERAETIKSALVKKGIASNRLLAVGYGESLPINHCANGVKCTTNEHLQNRRVEFVLRALEE